MGGRDVILMLFGGGFAVGVLEFIKFIITHFSNQKNRKEDRADTTEKKILDLKTTVFDHIDKMCNDIKVNYCEKNAKTIEQLSAISKDLKDNVVLLTEATIEIKEYEKNVGEALNGIIHDRIVHNVEGFIERGGITVDEISTLKSMYYPYKKLGGNGDVETAYEKVTNGEIPVITKEEAWRRDVIIQRNKIYGKETNFNE